MIVIIKSCFLKLVSHPLCRVICCIGSIEEPLFKIAGDISTKKCIALYRDNSTPANPRIIFEFTNSTQEQYNKLPDSVYVINKNKTLQKYSFYQGTTTYEVYDDEFEFIEGEPLEIEISQEDNYIINDLLTQAKFNLRILGLSTSAIDLLKNTPQEISNEKLYKKGDIVYVKKELTAFYYICIVDLTQHTDDINYEQDGEKVFKFISQTGEGLSFLNTELEGR